MNTAAWVEGRVVNAVDPSGNCPQNPHPLDAFGWRCRFLAESLASRMGVSAETYMWMDYKDLEALTALGSFADLTNSPALTGVRHGVEFVAATHRFFPQAWEQTVCDRSPEIYARVAQSAATWFSEQGVGFVAEPFDWGLTVEGWIQGDFHWIDLAALLPLIPSRQSIGEIVTVYRVHPIPSTGSRIVTGGAFRRTREGGATLIDAYQERQRLLQILSSTDPDVVRRGLRDAQSKGDFSPFISTTFNEQRARNGFIQLQTQGVNVELLTITGPRTSGVDFEYAFESLGGRLDRFGDAELEEFGIIDLYIPESGTSQSGFYIVRRE